MLEAIRNTVMLIHNQNTHEVFSVGMVPFELLFHVD